MRFFWSRYFWWGHSVPLALLAGLLLLGMGVTGFAGEEAPGARAGEPAVADEAARVREWSRLLRSANPQERVSAATLLMGSSHPDALQSLVQVLQEEGNEAAKISVLTVIGIKGDDRLLPQILPLLSAKEPNVRQGAQNALQGMRTPRARETISAVLNDREFSVSAKLALIDMLAGLHDTWPIPLLIKLLRVQPDSPPDEPQQRQLRRAAKVALERLTKERLGPDPEKWEAYWETVKGLSTEQWLEHLIRVLEAQNKALVRAAEEQWIARVKADPKNIRLLKDGLLSNLPRVVSYVAGEIAREKLTGAEAELIAALRDDEPSVRIAAAMALGETGSEKAIGPLMNSLSDPDSAARAEGVKALGKLKATQAVKPLLAMFYDGDEVLMPAIAFALGEIGATEAVEPLISVLQNEERPIPMRAAAASALGKLKDKRALPALIRASTDPKDKLRWSAVDALGELGDPEALPFLGKVLAEDKTAQVREQAAVSIGKIGGEAAVELLLPALLDSDANVRALVQTALLRVLGPRAERIEEICRELIAKQEFRRASVLLQAAIQKIEAPPYRMRQMRKMYAEALYQAQDWKAAQAAYQELFSGPDGDKDLTICLRLAECLDNLQQYDPLLKLYAHMRKSIPDKEKEWWERSAGVVEKLAKAKRYAEVVKAVDALENENPRMGGEQLQKQLTELRAKAKAALEASPLPAKPDISVVVSNILEQIVRDQTARAKAVPLLVAFGEAAVPHLIKHGLYHKDTLVQDATMDVLTQITKQPFNLPENPSPEQRRAAIEIWIRWWESRTPKTESK